MNFVRSCVLVKLLLTSRRLYRVLRIPIIMQKISIMHLLRLWCAALLFVAGTAHAFDGGSVAFYYGINPPVNALSQFDRLVVEADNVEPNDHRLLKRNGAATFAYISVGEVGPHRPWFNLVSDQATLGTNTDWASKVMDLSSAEWQRLLLQRVNELVNRGYDGLFLDTMDSYQIYAKNNEHRLEQEKALTNLLYRIKRKYPNIRLIANRGFEVIDQVAPYLEAIAAESLYAGWNNAEQSYKKVPENDRQWLTNKLASIQQQHEIDIIVIDYLPPAQRSEARDVAAQISASGFIPWIANPSLDYVGIGLLEVIPRDVLMVYDSRVNGKIEQAEVHSILAVPLEYMGYVPQYHDIAEKPLPEGVLKGKYAGVAIWAVDIIEGAHYPKWLAKQLQDTTPVALFSSPGAESTEEIYELMGLETVTKFDRNDLQLLKSDGLIGYESPIPPRVNQLSAWVTNVSANNTVHLAFEDKQGMQLDTVITGPWGGLALAPVVISLDVDKTVSWIIDPFTFLKKALHLTDAPMPDITTENGRRLWFAHIDGDALPSWAELPGRRLGAEVVRDEVIQPFDLPHTVSIVEAEMTGINAFADRRERMISTMREIFAMDNVESASHTFSHPFEWQKLPEGSDSGTHNLNLPGYKFDLEREIAGSISYIDNNLMPPGKKTKVLLWTGDATPPAEAMEVVAKYGLLNMNGGNTVISKSRPSITAISANTRMVGDHIQVYAPIMNENVFTNDWTGPFDGFRDVIQTFDMTDSPRRIKPINVYYHFYIGTKAASVRSLKEIYEWTEQQDIYPIFSSEYIKKVPYFRSAGVARHLDGRWKVSGLGPIRTLRTQKTNYWPDLKSSRSIVGTRKIHDGVYFHTDGSNTINFNTQSSRPQQPHLVSANAAVTQWEYRRSGQIDIRLTGHVPVELEVSGDRRYCQLRWNNTTIPGQLTTDGNTKFTFTTKDTGDAVIDCQT